jgi:uncharacterized protein (TIGR02145 family)
MKKIIIYFLLIFAMAKTQAQTYQIDFAGSGASNTVDSVRIENLTQCTDTTIGGLDLLVLSSTVGINELNTDADNNLSIYPNPMTGSCIVSFEATADGKTTIGLYDIAGKSILQVQEILSKGNQIFSLKGISSGLYFLLVKSENYSYSAKIACTNDASGIAEIKHMGAIPATNKQISDPNPEKITELKRGKSIISMFYSAGDLLKLTGKSGVYRTVFMLVPSADQTVTFIFVKCTDADSNYYAVVQIGTQLWMEENLKATHYRDGSPIPNVPDSATWGGLLTGAYCDYHNDPAEGVYYGHLYNFYAVADAHNICPIGWHVSDTTDWNNLGLYLGGDSIAGQKIKENCNTRWAYNAPTWGTNVSGFTALCANFRVSSGGWSMAPGNDHDGFYWTSTVYNANAAWAIGLRWCFKDIWKSGFPGMKGGYSVRCVHD